MRRMLLTKLLHKRAKERWNQRRRELMMTSGRIEPRWGTAPASERRPFLDEVKEEWRTGNDGD